MGDLMRSSDSPDSDGTTVIVNGDPVTLDQQTTVAELKEMAGADPDDIATYRDRDNLVGLNDDDIVLEHVPPGETLSFQPIDKDKNIFGAA
ncbi:hypothetical protein [Halomontanus rarus]|uniref:hypothetical protein n=1 Tax=Halomontanus rarus TaxID=3034020 RepID=UPI001A99CE51